MFLRRQCFCPFSKMRTAAGFALITLAALGAWPATAQLDEQPPVLHRRDSSPSPSDQNKKNSKKDTSDQVIAKGVVRQIDKRLITVEATDTRIITCNIVQTTEFLGPDGKLKREDIEPGMHVRLQGKPTADREQLDAISIEIENSTEKPADEKTATIQKVPDDEDRPILRHGIPPKRTKPESDDDEGVTSASSPASKVVAAAEPESAPTPKASPAAALIQQARESNASFTAHLPNLVCQQLTTRYTRESKMAGWQANDVVSATVTYVDGKENYADLKVGGHSEHKDMMAIKGQRSTGEFGSVLASIMDPGDRADFQFVKDADLHRIRTKVYDFKVTRANSDWTVRVSGQTILPGYSGRVWIARDTARVIRIERKADDIPAEFPVDVLEQTVDYDYVMIAGRNTLLPTESQNLTCERGSSFCARNTIEFRNYKEFRGDASINFEK